MCVRQLSNRLDERPSSLACRLRASPQTKRHASSLSTSECSPIVRSPTPCTSCPYRLPTAVLPAARWGTCAYTPAYVGGPVRPIVCTAWCVNFAFPWGGESYTPSTSDARPDNLTNTGLCVCVNIRSPTGARAEHGGRPHSCGGGAGLRLDRGSPTRVELLLATAMLSLARLPDDLVVQTCH